MMEEPACACVRVRVRVCVHPQPCKQAGPKERTQDPRPLPLCPDRLSVMSAALGFIQSTSVLLLLTQEFHFRTVTASSGTRSQASYGLPRARLLPALPAHTLTQPQPSHGVISSDSQLHCTSSVSEQGQEGNIAS